MDKLTLNDASVTLRKETSVALGPGFRCGFLGMLHMDVFMQRLFDEHGSAVRWPHDTLEPLNHSSCRQLLSCGHSLSEAHVAAASSAHPTTIVLTASECATVASRPYNQCSSQRSREAWPIEDA